ncbi:MAG TPA: hypothetical protein VFV28_04715 [Limnobacter sp.]|nr:hypothetical protein [Limnobacter sp.]
MKALRSYPGVLTLIVLASALLIHGFVDYLDYEVASPSILAALGCIFSALLLVAVYEIKAAQASRKLTRSTKA